MVYNPKTAVLHVSKERRIHQEAFGIKIFGLLGFGVKGLDLKIFCKVLAFEKILGILDGKSVWTHQEASSSSFNGHMVVIRGNPSNKNSGAAPESSSTKHNWLSP